MKIKTIGFGATKNTGETSSTVYLEADLESLESDNIDIYLDDLRKIVATQLNLDHEFSTVRFEIKNKKREQAHASFCHRCG